RLLARPAACDPVRADGPFHDECRTSGPGRRPAVPARVEVQLPAPDGAEREGPRLEPRVVAEEAPQRVCALGLDDRDRARAVGEPPGELDRSLLVQPVDERRVLVPERLLAQPASGIPGRAVRELDEERPAHSVRPGNLPVPTDPPPLARFADGRSAPLIARATPSRSAG